MSGGYFQYKLNYIYAISEQLKYEIRKQENLPEGRTGFCKDTIDVFKDTEKKLREVYEVVKKIDYLLSGDINEETFHENILNTGKVILDYYGFRKEMVVDKNTLKSSYIDCNLYNIPKTKVMYDSVNTEELTFATVRFYFDGYENGKPIFVYK